MFVLTEHLSTELFPLDSNPVESASATMHIIPLSYRYSRDKHSKPGRDVFSKLTDYHETNPTPRKPTRSTYTPTKQPAKREWVQNQRNLYTKWINAQFLPDKKYQVSYSFITVTSVVFTP